MVPRNQKVLLLLQVRQSAPVINNPDYVSQDSSDPTNMADSLPPSQSPDY